MVQRIPQWIGFDGKIETGNHGIFTMKFVGLSCRFSRKKQSNESPMAKETPCVDLSWNYIGQFPWQTLDRSVPSYPPIYINDI